MNFESFTLILGRLHPLSVHFPISFVLLLWVLELAGRSNRWFRLLAWASTLAAVILGLLLKTRGRYLDPLLPWHQYVGLAALTLLTLAFYAQKFGRKFYLALLTLTMGLVVACGFMGGTLSKGRHYLLPHLGTSGKSPLPAPLSTHPQFLSFEENVRPILEQNCISCHNDEMARQRGPNFFSLQGPAAVAKLQKKNLIVPFQKKKSGLYQALTYPTTHKLHMPMNAGKLSEKEIEAIGEWIEQGAFAVPEAQVLLEEKMPAHWAFLPPSRPQPPRTKLHSWAFNPLDQFLLQKWEEKKLAPLADLPPHKLLRRLSYDLRGLPPSYAETRSFRPADYEKKIEEYLASSRYGERWAQHWFDLVRYADSAGYDLDAERNWPRSYRNLIIKALQNDLPLNQLLRWQIAGDLLGNNKEAKYFTSFLFLGPNKDIGPPDPVVERDYWDNQLATTMQVYLGVDPKCARCHDHKDEPITQENYYSWLLPFQSLELGREDPHKVYRKMLELKWDYENRPRDQQYYRRRDQLIALPMSAFALSPKEKEFGPILIGGAQEAAGPMVSFSLPRFFSDTKNDPQFWEEKIRPHLRQKYQGRSRAILAMWLTDTQDGAGKYVARVMVDHIWRFYFGQGLAPISGNFGVSGARPLHPELLDWLTWDFIEHGWSLKHLHRRILTAHFYRAPTQLSQKDISEQDLALYRGLKPQRLDAEAIRDSILFLSGELGQHNYRGPSVRPYIEEYFRLKTNTYDWVSRPDFSDVDKEASVFVYRQRGNAYPMFKVLGAPNMNESTPLRSSPNGPVQSLFFLHSRFLGHYSKKMAQNLEQLHGKKAGVEAFSQILGRAPAQRESQLVQNFLQQYPLAGLIQGLFSSNEFLYVE